MTGHFVEELIHRFEVEQQKNDRGGIYALTQRMMAYNSNKIEGSTLTEKQTASLFDTGTLSSEDAVIRAKDVEEMTGHFLMFNEMLKTYDLPISHELIKRYHYKLKSGVFEDLANGIDNFIDLGAPLAYLGDPRIATAETGEKVYDIFSDIVTDEAEALVKK